MRFSAWYGIVVGFLMIGWWMYSFILGTVEGMQSAPWELVFRLAAEMMTALALIVGGARSLKSISGGRRLLLCALGMAIYSEIASAGYYAERGGWKPVGLFAILLAGALAAAVLLWKGKKKEPPAGTR